MATGSAYKIIWTYVTYAGIEIISIPVYAHVVTHVQIILYALPVATQANYAVLVQAYIVNRPSHTHTQTNKHSSQYMNTYTPIHTNTHIRQNHSK